MDRVVRVTDIERAIAHAYPPERAEAWDRVGLLAGDPTAPVTGVVLALDPTPEALGQALARGANVLVTHHPAYLKMPDRIVGDSGPAGLLVRAMRAGVSLINAHTNLDRDDRAQSLMPEALGLSILEPIEDSSMAVSHVTVFVSPGSVQAVRDGMVEAGAGRVGQYEECSFEVSGRGGFSAGKGASPSVTPDESGQVAEVRLEMVCPPHATARVVDAAARAHPYEEPLIIASDARVARNRWRLGRICRTDSPVTLDELAARVSRTYGITPRVWGDPETVIEHVGCTTGSGGSLIGAAIRRGVEAFIAGEVRYHDATDAVQAGVCVIEIGHDVSEWPLVGLLETVVRSVPGLPGDLIHALPPSAGWWIPKERTNA